MFMGSSAQNRSANRCPSSSFAEEHFRKPALSLASAHRELHDMAIPGFGEIAEQLRRSTVLIHSGGRGSGSGVICSSNGVLVTNAHVVRSTRPAVQLWEDRKSTRLNSSHTVISYAVFCLKKKKKKEKKNYKEIQTRERR